METKQDKFTRLGYKAFEFAAVFVMFSLGLFGVGALVLGVPLGVNWVASHHSDAAPAVCSATGER